VNIIIQISLEIYVRSFFNMMRAAYKYPDGSEYEGDWNEQGQRHGNGKMRFADGSRYTGRFDQGLCSGQGVMLLADGSRYEGQFSNGKFHGHGIFIRADGMKYEGEFKDGKVWGNGLLTFADGTHGLPRNEGYFEGTQIVRREKCSSAIQKARQSAEKSRVLLA
jgi:hypothetical protein